jgi:hypothetical protein
MARPRLKVAARSGAAGVAARGTGHWRRPGPDLARRVGHERPDVRVRLV